MTAPVTPQTKGRFGSYGGQYVPETLMPALLELEQAYDAAINDPDFQAELAYFLREYVGRETPLYFAERLTEHLGGPRIYLKREDLNHTGAHKINNTVGQVLLAKRMGKKRVIAETGAGQHGVATATVAARLGLECEVFMGEEDIRRQELNVFRMRLLGAKVTPVTSGSRTLKDATNEAIRQWVTHVEDTYYVIGSVVGPHPYPTMVRDFQSVIGHEARRQCVAATGGLPTAVIACVGGGSNAMGMFYAFVPDEGVRLFGVEAGGRGLASGQHGASLTAGVPGVLHGMMTYLLQDEDGQIQEAASISAGLDYPGVGPEHASLRDSGRVTYASATDTEALEALLLLTRLEGIMPALESAHAVAHVMKLASTLGPDDTVLICLSGRGDKDAPQISDIMREGGKRHG